MRLSHLKTDNCACNRKDNYQIKVNENYIFSISRGSQQLTSGFSVSNIGMAFAKLGGEG
jgi:hypothetical protein